MSARLQLSESKDPLNPSCHTLGCASRDTLDQNFDQGVLDKWSKAANTYEQRAPPILFVTKKDALNSIPTVNHGRSTTTQQLTLVLTRLADSAVETTYIHTCANTLGCFTTSVLVPGSLRLRCVTLLFAGGTHSMRCFLFCTFSRLDTRGDGEPSYIQQRSVLFQFLPNPVPKPKLKPRVCESGRSIYRTLDESFKCSCAPARSENLIPRSRAQ